MKPGIALYSFDWSIIPGSVPTLIKGLGLTIEITVLSLAASLVLGLLVALARLARFQPLNVVAFAYVQVFRALSLYVYILWVYFGLPALLGIDLSPVAAGVVSLTLLNSAYMSEIYRSAILAIDPGQWEAASSLGLSRIRSFGSVVLPQAFRIAVPSLVNQFVDIIKDSSLVAIVGASDLMYSTQRLVSFYNRPFEFYTTIGGIYLAMVILVSQLAARLERRLRVHLT